MMLVLPYMLLVAPVCEDRRLPMDEKLFESTGGDKQHIGASPFDLKIFIFLVFQFGKAVGIENQLIAHLERQMPGGECQGWIDGQRQMPSGPGL